MKLNQAIQLHKRQGWYDSQKNTTRPMRSKEFANDYRYFPEPDLLPVILDEEFINSVKETMPGTA